MEKYALNLHILQIETHYQPLTIQIKNRTLTIPTFRTLLALNEFFSHFPEPHLTLQIDNHIDHTLLSIIHMGPKNIPPKAKLPPIQITIPLLRNKKPTTPTPLTIDPLLIPIEINLFNHYPARISSLETISALHQLARQKPHPDHTTLQTISIGLTTNRLYRSNILKGKTTPPTNPNQN